MEETSESHHCAEVNTHSSRSSSPSTSSLPYTSRWRRRPSLSYSSIC